MSASEAESMSASEAVGISASEAAIKAAAVVQDPLGDLASRVRLGANPATSSEHLSVLAMDPAVTVRAAVALNPGTSAETNGRLATDPDERVRMLLARKVLSALPALSKADQSRMGAQTLDVLSVLVRDEAARVRMLVAEMVAGLPGVPRDLVLVLARDAAVPVSEPVLRLSPLLSASDLLQLLESPPHEAATTAIARRANLPADVADAIAASADNAAIRALLANPSAALRESTLDALIARAHAQPEWQEPLVRRPALPPQAARALSEFVANHWLKVLTERPDLPATLLSDLKQRLWARLSSEHRPDGAIADEAMMHAALRMEAQGQLDEGVLLDAARAGDSRRTAALLAVAAGVSTEIVDRAVTLRSAKALVSLIWKAGFSMRVAGPVQSLLGRLGPAGVLAPARDGGFPLTLEEMGWQLDLLARDRR